MRYFCQESENDNGKRPKTITAHQEAKLPSTVVLVIRLAEEWERILDKVTFIQP